MKLNKEQLIPGAIAVGVYNEYELKKRMKDPDFVKCRKMVKKMPISINRYKAYNECIRAYKIRHPKVKKENLTNLEIAQIIYEDMDLSTKDKLELIKEIKETKNERFRELNLSFLLEL